MIKLLNASHPDSLNQKLRRKRLRIFLQTIEKMEKPVKILDIGGTFDYWKNMNINFDDVNIVLLNLKTQPVDHPSFTSVAGDATDLKHYEDKSFDIVYSNSVIEHLFTKDNQVKMAEEVRRVGEFFIIQTPNKYFPIEPHWIFPYFQFLPKNLRVYLTHKFNLGNYPRAKTRELAIRRVEEVQLLSRKEMSELFPGARIWKEKFFYFNKSFIAHNNFNIS